MVGNPGRAEVCVEVILNVEVDPLPAVDLAYYVAAAGGKISPAGAVGGLQDRAVVTGFGQLVGRGHASDAGPQDHHAIAKARVGGQVGRRGRLGHVESQQVQRVHGPIDGGGPSGQTHRLQELPFRQIQGHGALLGRAV